MTRPRKQTVDYFPHYCHHGKTMVILEQKYGNDGYAFWFKTLELLGSSEGHFIDCNDPITWEYFTSKTHLTSDLCVQILDLLATLKAIDFELWQKKVIWSENFLRGIAFAYRNRVDEIPQKPVIQRKKPGIEGVSSVRNPRIEKNRIEKNRKEKKTSIPAGFKISDEVRQWAEKNGHNHLEAHLESFKDRALAKGYQYLNWDAAFKNAIREDWGKIGNGNNLKPVTPARSRNPSCPQCGGRGLYQDGTTKNGQPIMKQCDCEKVKDVQEPKTAEP